MDRTLLPEDISACPDFQSVLITDGYKLTEISDPIFRKAVAEIKAERPDIVLIPGDMSKDGEKLNHEKVREILQQLISSKIKVFVVPGNNDISSPASLSFANNVAEIVPNVSPDEFVEIYEDCGYNGTERDPNSLSYLSKPYPNLWILGIDCCKYPPSYSKVSRSGVIKPATLAWIQDKLAGASENDVTVLAMMHHNIIEHFSNNIKLNPGTVLDNWQASSQVLMDLGVRFVFTGHNHGNDITEMTVDGKTLTDIETGALTTPVSPYRIITIYDKFIRIETRHIRKINYPLPNHMDFLTYSHQAIYSRLIPFYTTALQSMFKLPADLAAEGAPFLTSAVFAQYAGDEWLNYREKKKIESLEASTPPEYHILIDAINSYWTDLPPRDNNLIIKLK
jgi:hypothetical protein